jgi:hypothetical protein
MLGVTTSSAGPRVLRAPPSVLATAAQAHAPRQLVARASLTAVLRSAPAVLGNGESSGGRDSVGG